MRELTRSMAGRWMAALLHTHDTPARTAAAFALGVGIGFSPFVGFHTAIGIALAFVFSLNRVAVLAGLWVNLPWFMGPYYTAATVFGAWVTRRPVPPRLLRQLATVLDLPTWHERADALGHLLHPLLVPYLAGSLICGVLLGLVAYRVTLAVLLARQRRGLASGAFPRPDSHSQP
jgi:hypothetical protein